MTASRHRISLTVAFALLLLFMQHEAQVHVFVHAGGVLHSAQEQGLQAPAVEVSCLECSLLAGGSSAVVGDLPSSPPATAPSHAFGAIVSRSLTAPSYYSSRAPPPLL